jgi:hypothetical protein
VTEPHPDAHSAPPPQHRSIPARRATTVLAEGVVSGLVAAAAVTGILVGIGRRTGLTWRPLNAAAHTLVGARADQLWNAAGDVTPMGGLVVLVVSVTAGVAVASLSSSHRRLQVVAAGAGVALAGYLLHLHVVARTPGGLAALLSVGELRALYLTAGLGLLAGMRIAPGPVTGHRDRTMVE